MLRPSNQGDYPCKTIFLFERKLTSRLFVRGSLRTLPKAGLEFVWIVPEDKHKEVFREGRESYVGCHNYKKP
jgi:hypothetical protein